MTRILAIVGILIGLTIGSAIVVKAQGWFIEVDDGLIETQAFELDDGVYRCFILQGGHRARGGLWCRFFEGAKLKEST